MTTTEQTVVQQTKTWLKKIVIGLKLCPFAEQPFQSDSISYTVSSGDSTEQHLQQLADDFTKLDTDTSIETSLLIYPDAYQTFEQYLQLLELANGLLEDLNYTGIYQIASFHPDYQFQGSAENDASNFSNRSPWPMLHLIREDSLKKILASYPDIEQIPENNIKKLRDIGFQQIKILSQH